MGKRNRLHMKDAPLLYQPMECENTFKYLGYTIKFKRYLTMQEKIKFVQEVADWCTIDGDFNPIVFDFGVRCVTLDMYTNLTIPTGQKALTELALGSLVYEELLKHINIVDYDAMVTATKEHIEKVTTKRNPYAGIIKYIEDILAKYDEEIQSIDLKQFYKILQIVDKMDDKKDIVMMFKDVYKKED